MSPLVRLREPGPGGRRLDWMGGVVSEIEFKPVREGPGRGPSVRALRGRASVVVEGRAVSSDMSSSTERAAAETGTGHGPWEMGDRPVLRIESAEQFRALASPVRDQIINVVANLTTWRADGTAEGVSIRQIGDQLGRKPASLYRHIEALVSAGLIREIGSQSSGGRDATTYAAMGTNTILVAPTEEGPALDAMREYIMSVAMNAGREAAAAAADRVTGAQSFGPNDTGGAVLRGWLDQEQRATLRRIQKELDALFSDTHRRPGTRLMAATLLFRPTRLPDGSIADEPAGDDGSGE